MKRLFLSFAAALCALSVHAQDPQKPEPQPQTEPQQQPEAPPAPGPGQERDPKIIADIFACVSEGLPEGWKKAWFVISEVERNVDGSSRKYEARFRFATSSNDRKGRPFKPCGAERVREGVVALNDYLPDSQRRWTGATFTFTSEGEFEIKYDYTPRKPAPARPAAKKPAAGKS